MKKSFILGLALVMGTFSAGTAQADFEQLREDIAVQPLLRYETFWYDCVEYINDSPGLSWYFVPADHMHSLFGLSYQSDSSGTYWNRGTYRDIQCSPRMSAISPYDAMRVVTDAFVEFEDEVGNGARIVDARIISLSASGPVTAAQLDESRPFIRWGLLVRVRWADNSFDNRMIYVRVFHDD